MTNYCVYVTCKLYVTAETRDDVYEQLNNANNEDFEEWDVDRIEERE